MTRFTLTLVAAGLMATASASTAQAAGVDTSRIPADAIWLAHLDVQATLKSDFGQLVLRDLNDLGLDAKFDAIESLFGVDPLNDFESITLFADRYGDDDDVVALIEMNNLGKLGDLVQLAEDHKRVDYGDYAIHSFIEDHHHGKKHRKFAGVYPLKGRSDRSLLVFAHDRQTVVDQIDLLNGQGESLRDHDETALSARPSKGAALFIVGTHLERIPHKGRGPSHLARLARSVTMEVGERRGEVFASARVVAEDEDKAGQMRAIVEGMKALMLLAGEKHPEGAILAQNLETEVDDATVTATFTHPAKDMHSLLKQMKEKHDRHHRDRKAKHDRDRRDH